MSVKTTLVTGIHATHEIKIMPGVHTMDDYIARKHELKAWRPENGSEFGSTGKARGWLSRLLKKHGWPKATVWEIHVCEQGGIAVYRVENSDSTF